ncbi:hypothetical protein ABZ848_19050 [Streptomyces sp. NPDC047081]|uniref:hypothetical protein n=1 Tax=Streptomyces sp. NPDC047081 TaxID=3154706 RepID=UPI0033C38797
MTAGHETHGEYDGPDALMAAITGEPLPDGADAAFRAEHRAAEADVALLREQLGLIGDALAEERALEATAPVRRPRGRHPRRTAPRAPRNRRAVRRFAFAGLAVAAVGGVFSGMIWLVGQAGGGANDSSASSAEAGGKAADSAQGSPFSSPGYLACTRLVAEGDVTAVEQMAGDAGQERITLHVTRSYKPEKTKPDLTLMIDEEALAAPLRKGDHILVAVPRHASTPDYVLTGEKPIARERAALTRALPEAASVPCE